MSAPPADWKEVRLGEICEIYQPTTIGGKDFKESGEFVVYGANGPIGRYNRYNHEDPEVTVTCRGATCGTVNVTPPRVWITGNAMVVRPKAQTLSKLMLKYILQALDYSDVITGAAQPQITGAGLSPCQILVPPLKEQEAIAEALSDADAAIESLDALIAKKRDVKEATMQQLLTGRTRLPGFTADWKEVRLGDLVSRPITDGPHLTPKFYNDGVPFLSVNNIVDGKILWNDLRYISKEDDKAFSIKCKPRRGDILFGKAASVGKIALVDTDIDFNVWSPLAVIRCSALSSSQFVHFALQTRWITQQIALLTNSSSQGNIGMTDIAQIKISLPPLKEQEAIAEALTVMDDELEALTEQVSKLRMVKEGMMQDLLTGKVRLV